ncbi:MAG: aldo/keto reductase [Tannerella sp.]|jgi:aryl-alcohol dehydrogenase-like predicted oxidoreductase|nr:aldo/keto reductase [Tannerella sp.]
MKQISRRKFILTGTVGLAGLTVAGKGLAENIYSIVNDTVVDKVRLGNSGLTVSRIAMGTGTRGYNNGSNQTRAGMDSFVKLAHHAYERGITFYDMAEGYGSMPYVAESIKNFPRENLTLLSKIWTYAEGNERVESAPQFLDRFRKAVNTDYFDIILMHCMSQGDWSNTRKSYVDGLSKAKQDGIVKAIGVSCHNINALAEAADSPWVDVIMARINPFGKLMDGTPDEVKAILLKAIQNGKGVIGMKIFAEGQCVSDEEREQSIQFTVKQKLTHSMTMGFESTAQMDDAIERVMKHV